MEKVLPLLFFARKVKAHSRSFFFLFSGGVSEQVISKKKKGGSPPPCCQLVGRPCPHPSSTRRPGSVSVAMTAMSGCERAVKRSLELARWRDQSSFRQKKKKKRCLLSLARSTSLDSLFSLFSLPLPINPQPFPPAAPGDGGGGGFLSPCFQDAAFVVLPLALLVVAVLLLSAVRGSGDGGGGGDRPRQRPRRRRRRTSPSASSSLRVAALRSSLLLALSGVAMIISFCFIL